MNGDELAFVNRQLAGMLSSGIPLEGALRRLCANMKQGGLRGELELLEADLARGLPLKEALDRRTLPEFYVRMLQVGVQGNDLPGVLLLLADYYSRINTLTTRLKGLMVYPVLVLLTATLFSFLLALILQSVMADSAWLSLWEADGSERVASASAFVWLPVTLMGLGTLLVAAAISIPALRRRLRWRLPGFQEASLCQFAASMNLLLRGGSSLGDSLGLMQQLEQGTTVGREIDEWRARLAQGYRKMGDVMGVSAAVPPLFVWLVESAGEDVGAGFGQAAEIYRGRAVYRMDLLLYAALPLSILTLGGLILCQITPILRAFIQAGTALM
jgi:type II secretory pathway component PulF